MINEVTLSFFLILVALVGADDLKEGNCKDAVGCLRSGKYDLPSPQEFEDRAQQLIYVYVGVFVAVIIAFGVTITVCLFCACCPVYKYRHKQGTIYTSATKQQQPVTFYQQPPYYGQPPPYYGQQPTYYGQQINGQLFPQPGFVYSPGQVLPQTLNAPYNSVATEYQTSPGIGQYAGSPEEPPANYQTSPQNQSMNTNCT